MFAGLSLPAMIVAENSKVVATNEGAAALFVMPVEELIGQRWAGLDANSTLIRWKGYWRRMGEGEKLTYVTDIETSRQYMRPITVEARRVTGDYALITLADRIEPDITDNEIVMLAKELRVGRWSYNRVDGHLEISSVCRELIGIPDGPVSKLEIGQLISAKMAETDFVKMANAATKLLAAPGEASLDFVIESTERTSLLNFVCHSIGNELHVTHLYGIVRRRTRSDGPGSDELDKYAQLAAFSVDQADDIILWTQPDDSVVYANIAASRQLGYGHLELQEVGFSALVAERDQASTDDSWRELRQHKNLRREYYLRAKDGSVCCVEASVNYVRLGEEEFACIIGHDATSDKLAAERNRLMEFSLERADGFIVWVRNNGDVHSVNNNYLEHTGFTPRQVEDMQIGQVCLDANVLDESTWDQLRTGQSVAMETKIHTASGGQVPVRAKMNYFHHDGEELCCLYFTDISTERDREQQLHLAQTALNKTAECVLWLDDTYRIKYANETLRQFLPSEMNRYLIGRDVLSILPGLDRSKIEAGEKQEFSLTDKAGDVHQMQLGSSLLNHNENRYYVLSAKDLTAGQQERDELESAFTEVEVMRDRLRDENVSLREDNDTKYNVNNIITVSRKYQKILTQVGQVADVDTTVLITGETGTGKELLARAVHQLSAREDFPLIKVNCAALPESLIESELFGHEKGAFTGAINRKKGRFEMADRGTIFLDEIGELPLDLQAKLLRVLQEDEFERLGGETTIKVDVRMIAATNRDLEDMVRKGKFREDLYYRLNVFPIHNLPLRDRPEDIPVLIEYFTKKYAKRQGKKISKISSADIKRISTYPFPGNIRELENIIERSVVLCQSDTLSIDFVRSSQSVTAGGEAFLSFEEMQRRHILDALRMTRGRMTGPTGAGILLEMNDRTLVSKIRKLGIEKHEYLL